MSEPFLGEIRIFAGNFAPQGWAFCDGQLLAVSQYDALFSLVGTRYGGDGQTTFGLPDLRGRVPLHMGSGPGLSPRPIGQRAGQERVTLTANQLPSHSHTVNGTTAAGSQDAPAGNVPAANSATSMYAGVTPSVDFNSQAVSATGGNQAHANIQPYLALNFIIALVGIYPSRN